ncbi:MAG: hypothetical protein AAF217_00545 [Pseudomonadota bacterium]
MKRKTMIIAASIAGVVGLGGFAFAAQGYKEHKQMKRMFAPEKIMQKIDTDGDAAVSKGEISKLVSKHFGEADLNSDGQVTKAEIVNAIDNIEGISRLKRRSGKLADRMVRFLDVNQDSVLTTAEIENRIGKFHALADWNDDQKVELAEIKRMRGSFRSRSHKK